MTLKESLSDRFTPLALCASLLVGLYFGSRYAAQSAYPNGVRRYGEHPAWVADVQFTNSVLLVLFALTVACIAILEYREVRDGSD